MVKITRSKRWVCISSQLCDIEEPCNIGETCNIENTCDIEVIICTETYRESVTFLA